MKNFKILRKIPKNPSPQSEKNPLFHEENFHFFITCQAGVESLVKKESEKIGLKNLSVQDRIVRGVGTKKNMYELLMKSRFANRIYLELKTEKTETFDELFSVVKSISWKHFLPKGIAIVTEATAIKSQLSHTPSIQSIAKKAIVTNLTEWTGTHHLFENRDSHEAHIQIFLIQNCAHILLDITGNALHKRGYRTETGDAPIKETLAAAIIALSSWRFHENFMDPFCGSGTFAIEAAMLARNIAPWMGRHFALENFPFFEQKFLSEVRMECKENAYSSGKYKIFASDISEEMTQIAQRNARRAGVENDIIFCTEDFFAKKFDEKITILTNPPYWVRLENDSDEAFYQKFVEKMQHENVSGGFITSFDGVEQFLQKNLWKNRKLYNGWLSARFYKKIP